MRAIFVLMLLGLAGWAGDAQAWQSCERIVVGMQGNNAPVFQDQCIWLAGAVAVDPTTREFSVAWNYADGDDALDYVVGQCGPQCAAWSFYQNLLYVAVANDDSTAGSGTSEAAALADCKSRSEAVPCEVVFVGSSSQKGVYWHYRAIAYEPTQSRVYGVTGQMRGHEAYTEAQRRCGGEDCFVYVYQNAAAAVVRTQDGRLYAASARDLNAARREAMKACAKESGSKKACEIVGDSSSFDKPPPGGWRGLLENLL
jgi:hypothetical protein